MTTTPAWAAHLPEGVEWSSIDLTAGVSIPAVFARHAAADPDRAAIYTAATGWVSRGELLQRSEAIAGRFDRAGLRRGDRILCSATASVDLVCAHLGALRMGLVVVPANTAYQAGELQHLVHDARPAAAVVDRDEAAAWITAADPSIIVTTPAVDLDAGGAPPLDDATSGDAALIGYTSGTTGRPKGAVLSHGNLLAGVESVRFAWRWTAADRLILALPLFHAHGLGVGLHGTLVTGGSAVLMERFDVDTVIEAVADHGATMFFGVPTMYGRLAESPRAASMSALRLCVSGSAPLPAALHARIAETTGQVVLERYGMTETLMLVSNPYDGERRAGTVGWPLPGVDLRLAAQPEGEIPEGEIMVRGPSVFDGYWGHPPLGDEWFATGDIGRFDDGYLRIVGRSKELIISGGYNVYPREVEDALLSHPAVAEVAVVGLPSAEWGETVAAFVVASGPVEDAALIDYTRTRLAHFKCPREIRFVAELPRNAMGKILRNELR